MVRGNAVVRGNVQVAGNADISGTIDLNGNIQLFDNAMAYSDPKAGKGCLSIGIGVCITFQKYGVLNMQSVDTSKRGLLIMRDNSELVLRDPV